MDEFVVVGNLYCLMFVDMVVIGGWVGYVEV